ncbi:hypothetical protein DFQ28_002051 [Apophysomyces sp. BC1034]|nr:hypothetical protein DFQ29_001449 [Apophysomyces sp. BC1021]KAG0190421.1 hypothetical protein DFQ28_002051 [Apophysomyces sp. BC1034]
MDAQEFLLSEQWYSDRGIPFRRGYLLYGTPGSGKTSFVYSLAEQLKGELGLNIYVVNLSNKSLTDDTLGELVSETPSRCILLIEDVDAAFVQRVRGESTATNNVTFSGRIDVRVHFGNATRKQAYELFTKFYPTLPDADTERLAAEFASKIPETEFSMAHLQGFLMGHKRNPKAAVDLVSTWVDGHRKDEVPDNSTTNDDIEDIEEVPGTPIENQE